MRVSGNTLPASSGSDLQSVEITTASPRRGAALDLIEVRAPYCALREVDVLQPGRVAAQIVPEQAVDLEVGAIAAAEAGRHMAILGSVACASVKHDPARRFYYLAQRALLSSPDELAPDARAHRELHLSADCLNLTTREAQADCQIRTRGGSLLFGLNVSYKLVPDKIFERLFSSFRVDMRRAARGEGALPHNVTELRQSPYRRRLELEVVELDRSRMRGELPAVPAEACAGHFPLYPAVPVAVLMEVFSNAGGALLRSRLDAPALRYRVRSADILASKLVFAGQPITIRGEILPEQPARGVRMQMLASLSDGEEVSRATFIMEGVEAAVGS